MWTLREIGLMARVATSGVRHDANPYKLNFAFTYRCNSRCVTCDIWKKQPEGELNPHEIGRVARATPSIAWISLTGGEPFLRSDIVDTVRAFTDHLPRLALLNIPTNGSFPERIEKAVREMGRTRVPRILATVSMDGDEALHDETRGIPGGWRKAVETFQRLRAMRARRRGLSVYWAYTINPWNVGAFERTLAAARAEMPDLTPHDFHVNIYHESPHYYANQGAALGVERALPGSPERARPDALGRNAGKAGFNRAALAELEAINRLKGGGSLDPVAAVERTYVKLARRYVATGATPLACMATMTNVFLDSTGDVFPCTIFGHRLGNVRDVDYDLRRLLRTPEADATREVIAAGKCPNCWTPCESYPMIFASPVRSLRAMAGPDPILEPMPELVGETIP